MSLDQITPISSTIENTMALPCVADQVYNCPSIETAQRLLASWSMVQRPLVLGGGSNVILPETITAPVIQLKSEGVLFEKTSEGLTRVVADAGLKWDDLVAQSVEKRLYGIENLSWIPGSVGAAPVQNIGAYGCELQDVLEYVEVFDWDILETVRLGKSECDFAYRDSIFKQNPGRFVIFRISLLLNSSGEFKLNYGELKPLQDKTDLSLAEVRQRVIEVRQAKLPDPEQTPNTGSFFKNPVVSVTQYQALKAQYPELIAYHAENDQFKLAAGWLIDQAGWKGRQIGHVRVHDRQALVLCNAGGANQQAIKDVAELIAEDIENRYQVRLEIEPVLIES